VRGLVAFAEEVNVSSLHLLFPADADVRALREAGFMIRESVQFHWTNAGYADFDAFLATMSHDKRKKIRQDRKKVAAAGLTFRWLRGAEIGAEIVLKATKVDGIYSADPNKDPTATRYARISFDEAIVRRLEVMDATAFALCRDQKLPIKVFSINKSGALKRVVSGEDEGTLVHV